MPTMQVCFCACLATETVFASGCMTQSLEVPDEHSQTDLAGRKGRKKWLAAIGSSAGMLKVLRLLPIKEQLWK